MTNLQFTRVQATEIIKEKNSAMGEIIFHELFYAVEDFNRNRALENRYTLIKYKKGAILCNINNKIVAVLTTNCNSFDDFIVIKLKSKKDKIHTFKFNYPKHISLHLNYIDNFHKNLATN